MNLSRYLYIIQIKIVGDLRSKELLWVILPNIFIELFFLIFVGGIIGSAYQFYVAVGTMVNNYISMLLNVSYQIFLDYFSDVKHSNYELLLSRGNLEYMLIFNMFPSYLLSTIISIPSMIYIIYYNALKLEYILLVNLALYLLLTPFTVKLGFLIDNIKKVFVFRAFYLYLTRVNVAIIPSSKLLIIIPLPAAVFIIYNPVSILIQLLIHF
ncbi:hypothetical protein YG5714_0863 [Sulfolobus islandicus Y.G.57.14]|jgi:hypothetical protein|uniref:Uncharacterized protein n=1 Tax=Saccharolobus islandicus (strain Y.G.57.14 / Yellowstone \|nr:MULTISPECIES: hypothetical protein [Sulfolobaceae]ACP45143.1 hypothetical protein YG5714_0863 [Sulfolobus islandicus Y.G.57.14]MDT7862659.1 hypothetical protein [Saccharolobus sp.]